MSDIHAVPASSIQAKSTKSTIAKQKGKAKKGLGAKRVAKIDFESLEKDAEHEAEMEKNISKGSTSQNSSSSPQSIESAYQNLSMQEKKNESKMNEMSEKKQIQAQRLGMGFGKAKPNEVRHSLDMVTIKQTTPSSHKQRHRYDDDDDGDTFFNARSTFSGRNYDSIKDDGDWIVIPENKKSRDVRNYDAIEPIVQSHQAESNLFGKSIAKKPAKTQSQSSSSRSSKMESVDRDSKSVSSDQLFSRSSQREHQQQMNQARVEGRSGISSDDFYGRPATTRNSYQQHVPDMYDIKEGVRQGVRSVAGKLSSVVGAINEAIEERRYN